MFELQYGNSPHILSPYLCARWTCHITCFDCMPASNAFSRTNRRTKNESKSQWFYWAHGNLSAYTGKIYWSENYSQYGLLFMNMPVRLLPKIRACYHMTNAGMYMSWISVPHLEILLFHLYFIYSRGNVSQRHLGHFQIREAISRFYDSIFSAKRLRNHFHIYLHIMLGTAIISRII